MLTFDRKQQSSVKQLSFNKKKKKKKDTIANVGKSMKKLEPIGMHCWWECKILTFENTLAIR